MRIRVASLLLAFVVGACGSSDDGGSEEGVELTVSGAASLTNAFKEIGDDFEADNPSVSITFNFGPSDGLATQINEGAPVDMFASASPTWMDAVEEEPGVDGRADFATNELGIVVPSDNPAEIEDLDDLAEDGVKLVLAAEGVPAGDYAREALTNAGIADQALANVVSNEEDVRGVITKVLTGEADAGIGYVTDVTADVEDEIALVTIPPDQNVVATYPIAVVGDSEEAEAAQRFVDFVLGPGQETLAAYGFKPA